MQVTVKANFNKQTKDSKKELIQFYVKGEDEKRSELNAMTRAVVELSIDEVDTSLTAEFVKSAKDSKKTILEFVVKGDTSASQSYEFYKAAGSDVILTIKESQMSIEEFRGDDDEGTEYTVHGDGTVELEDDEDQLDMDAHLAAKEGAAAEEPGDPGDDLPF